MNSQFIILIADNSGMQRNLIKKILNKQGYTETLEAEDGKQALDILMQYKVDLIISGVNMQKVNGLELVKAIKNHSVLKSIPFIAMGFEVENKMINEIMLAGAAYFIKKPFTQTELIDNIGAVIKNI